MSEKRTDFLPDPRSLGIEHVVVVTMENRSFDHLLGWLPNANGRQAGLTYRDNNGEQLATHRLSYYVSCTHPDPDHCTLEDVFESLDTGGRVVNAGNAMQVALAKHSKGGDNEAYDFYLFMKSERMQGWTVRQSFEEK
jgi:phospholipase C